MLQKIFALLVLISAISTTCAEVAAPNSSTNYVIDGSDTPLPLVTVKLAPRVRISPNPNPTVIIPLSSVEAFKTRNSVVGNESFFANNPYIIGMNTDHLIASDGDKIFVRDVRDPNIDTYDIVYEGQPYIDPSTRKVLGYEVIYVAEAKVLQLGQTSVMLVQNAQKKVEAGYFLFPQLNRNEGDLLPHAPTTQIDASIIEIIDNQATKTGTYETVVLSAGREEGVDKGTVLSIYQSSGAIADPVTQKQVPAPDLLIGKLVVMRSFKHVSFALVTSSTQEINLLDRVGN